MHQINTFQQVSAKQSIWQWLHPLRCYRKSTWFWHFFVIKPHFSPNRKIITAQCYARYLTRAWWSQQTYQHFFRQFIFQRVAFERRPILLASRIPQYQRLAHMCVVVGRMELPVFEPGIEKGETHVSHSWKRWDICLTKLRHVSRSWNTRLTKLISWDMSHQAEKGDQALATWKVH